MDATGARKPNLTTRAPGEAEKQGFEVPLKVLKKEKILFRFGLLSWY